MFKKNTIAIVEPSEVINEGLANKLKNTSVSNIVSSFYTLEAFLKSQNSKNVQILLLNPNELYNNEKEFEKWYNNSSVEYIIAIIYQIFPEEKLSLFHDSYTIYQPFSQLLAKILKNNKKETLNKKVINVLSNREKEVLKYLAKGLSVKEIADKMFLSPHTVLTHRKNISQKTGIKTIAGLTVYVVSSKLISLNELEEI